MAASNEVKVVAGVAARQLPTVDGLPYQLLVAKALRKARKADPGRRVLFAQALEKVIDVATEFAFKVDLALEQVPERDKKQAAEALLQPDPEETIANAVMLHDKESLSTPWIIGYVSLRVPTSASCLALFCFAVR